MFFFRDFDTESDTDDDNDGIAPLEVSETNTDACVIAPSATSEKNEASVPSAWSTITSECHSKSTDTFVKSPTQRTASVIAISTPKRSINDDEPADEEPSQSTPPKEALVRCSGICCLTDIVLSPIPTRYVVKSPFMAVSTSSSASTLIFSPVKPPKHVFHECPISDGLECDLCNLVLGRAAIYMP